MPINPMIPLSTQTPEIAPVINNALLTQARIQQMDQAQQEAPLRNQLLQAQVQGAGLQNQVNQQQLEDLKQLHDTKSIVYGALSVKPLLDSGNTKGALEYLTNRRNQIKARGGDTSDTDQVIAQLTTGDTAGALNNVNQAIGLGQQLGILQKVPQAPDAVQELVAAGYKPGTPQFEQALFRLKGQDKSITPYQQAQLDIDRQKLDVERQKLKQGPDGPQAFKQATELRKEFIDQSKDYRQQNESIGRIAASAKDPSAAGDLSLIFNYMKVLDPGSTVREGEFATAQNAGGVGDRTIAAYNKVLNGERLSDSQRQDFVTRADKLFTQARGQHEKRVAEYSRLAKQNNLDPQNVIVDFTSYQPEQNASNGQFRDGQTATNPQTGEKLIFRNGQWQKM